MGRVRFRGVFGVLATVRSDDLAGGLGEAGKGDLLRHCQCPVDFARAHVARVRQALEALRVTPSTRNVD